MRLVLLLLISLLALGAPGGAGAQMQVLRIMDNQGFGAPMTAYTIDVPQGWSARGEILWVKPCSASDLYELVIDIQSPDGRSGFRVQPGHRITWTDIVATGFDPALAQMMRAQVEADRNRLRTQVQGSNCHVALINDPDQLFQALVARTRPADLEVRASTPNEAVLKQYEAIFLPQPGLQVFHDARQIEMTYSLPAGKVHETLFLSWYMFQLPPLDPAFGTFSQTTTVEALRSVRVAEDRRAADEALLAQVIASLRVDPVWQARVDEVNRARAEAARRAAEQRRDDNEAAWQRRQIDRIFSDFRADLMHWDFLDMIRQ